MVILSVAYYLHIIWPQGQSPSLPWSQFSPQHSCQLFSSLLSVLSLGYLTSDGTMCPPLPQPTQSLWPGSHTSFTLVSQRWQELFFICHSNPTNKTLLMVVTSMTLPPRSGFFINSKLNMVFCFILMGSLQPQKAENFVTSSLPKKDSNPQRDETICLRSYSQDLGKWRSEPRPFDLRCLPVFSFPYHTNLSFPNCYVSLKVMARFTTYNSLMFCAYYSCILLSICLGRCPLEWIWNKRSILITDT